MEQYNIQYKWIQIRLDKNGQLLLSGFHRLCAVHLVFTPAQFNVNKYNRNDTVQDKFG